MMSGAGGPRAARGDIGAKPNPLLQLSDFGQSIWLDYVRRSLIAGGELACLIKQLAEGMLRRP